MQPYQVERKKLIRNLGNGKYNEWEKKKKETINGKYSTLDIVKEWMSKLKVASVNCLELNMGPQKENRKSS